MRWLALLAFVGVAGRASTAPAQMPGSATDLHRLHVELQRYAKALLERDGITFYAVAGLITPDGSFETFTPDHWPDLQAPPAAWADSLVTAFRRSSHPVRAAAMLVDWSRSDDTFPRDTTALFHGETATLCRESRDPMTGLGEGSGRIQWGRSRELPCSPLLWTGPGAAPCAELPVGPGRWWTYRASVSWTGAGASASRDTTIIWVTRILGVRARDSIAVGVVENWPTALAWWEPGQKPDTSLLVCIRNRVYHVATGDGPRPALQDSLLAAQRAMPLDDLLFQFPLRAGDLYGRDPADRADNLYAWYVDSAAAAGATLRRLGARSGDSVRTLTYRTLPDHQIIDFVSGLGISRYVYAHHGTVARAEAVLVGTTPRRDGSRE